MSDVPPSAELFSAHIEAALYRFKRMVRAAGVRHGILDDEVDALVQEVRIRLWRAHPASEEIGRLPTSYLYRTATTAALDLVRKRRRQADREASIDSSPRAALVSRTRADHDVLASDLGAAIMRELETMVEARRVVVRMHLSGYEREEILAILGWSDAKVRNLLYRGLADLRERLTRAGYRWPEGIMSDEKLRAIYDARVASNVRLDRENCPTPEQLQRLAESGVGGTAPNLKLLDHVFGCAYCRPEFSLLRAVQAGAETADGVSGVRTRAWSVWLTGPRLAIAAGVLVAIGLGGESLRRMNSDSETLRGVPTDASDVVIVAPSHNLALTDDAQFVWRKVRGAVSYEVQLLDTAGVVIATHVTVDTVYVPTEGERNNLVIAKVFDWFVAARRADGNERRSQVVRTIVNSNERR